MKWPLINIHYSSLVGFYGSAAYCFPKALSYFESLPDPDSVSAMVFHIVTPMFFHPTSYFLACFSNSFNSDVRYFRNEFRKLRRKFVKFRKRDVSDNSKSVEKYENRLLDVLAYAFLPKKFLKKYAHKKNSPELLFELAFDLFNESKFDEGFLTGVSALDIKKNYKQDSLYRILNKLNSQTPFFYPKKRSLFYFAAINALTYDVSSAYKFSYLGRIAADYYGDLKEESYVLHALFSSYLNCENEDDDWKDVFNILSSDSIWTRLGGETRNLVSVLSNTSMLSKTVRFMYHDDRKYLLSVFKKAEELQDVSSMHVPNPVYVSQEKQESGFVYVSRFIEGVELQKKFDVHDYSTLPKLAEPLFLFHDRVEYSERLDIYDKLKMKVFDERVALPNKWKKQIVSLSKIIVDYFKSENTMWGENRDFHPKNIIVGEFGSSLIDTEPSNGVPVQFDLANLLEYSDSVPLGKRLDFVKGYHSFLNDVDLDWFLLGYAYATYVRMIDFMGAWHQPGRETLLPDIPSALNRAYYSIASARSNMFVSEKEKLGLLTDTLKDCMYYFENLYCI